MRRRNEFVIRGLLTIGLLAVLVWFVDISAALASLADADPSMILLGLLAVQGQIVLSGIRWRFTAARVGQTIALGDAIGEYYLTSLVNLALPAGIGGDALRAARATQGSSAGGATVVRAVVLERFAGQVALFALAVIGVASWIGSSDVPLPDGTIVVLLVPPGALLTVAALIWISRRLLPEHWLSNLGPDIRRSWFAGHAWLVQGGLSITIALLYVAAFGAASAAIGAALPWMALLAFVPLTLLTMLLPVSIGGFGLREAAAAALWPLAGFSAAEGLAASVLYGLIAVLGASPGLFRLLCSRPYSERRA